MRGERRWQECTSVPRLQSAMTWLSIAIPLMIAALAVAVVPVLVGSFRHDNAPEVRFRSPAEESEFWHHLLGHHSVEDFAAPSHLVERGVVLHVAPAHQVGGGREPYRSGERDDFLHRLGG